MPKQRETIVCLRSPPHWCPSPSSPYMLPSMLAIICCIANTLRLLFVSSLFLVSDDLSDVEFCISDLCFYVSPSFPSFSPAALFSVSSCVIFLGTYGPWHCHMHKFLLFFLLFFFFLLFVLLFLYLSQLISGILTDTGCALKTFSHPRVSKCDMQSGFSPAVRADSPLALINWSHSRRKRMLWAFTISGSRLPCFLCLLTLVQSHTRMEEKSQDIGFMMLLQGARYFLHSQNWGSFFPHLFSRLWKDSGTGDSRVIIYPLKWAKRLVWDFNPNTFIMP